MASDNLSISSKGLLPPFARSPALPVQRQFVARIAVQGFLSTLHRSALVFGLVAIAVLGIMFFNPHLTDRLKAISPFAKSATEEPIVATALPLKELPANVDVVASAASANFITISDHEMNDVDATRQQKLAVDWLSRRYHIASDAISVLVAASYAAARETRLDPLLILAVMSVESRFNPFAESALGAQGLMQVISKDHLDKFDEVGGAGEVLNPVANIHVGSRILKDYVMLGGSVESGLKLYVAAAALDSNANFDIKILAAYHQLKHVVFGEKSPANIAPVGVIAPK